MSKDVKRVGDYTYYMCKGKEVCRPRHNKSGNPSKSLTQDANRRRWKNIMNLWRMFKNNGWCPRYQDKAPGKSDYNCFTAFATQGTNIYLSKDEAKGFACVLLPLTISDGTLPTIQTEFDGEGVKSDISVGNLTLSPETRVCNLAQAIMFNNRGYQKGDTITFVAGRQEVWPPYNHPHVCFRSCVLPLDPYDGRPLLLLPHSEEAFCVRDGRIASTMTKGACTWLHERMVQAGDRLNHYCSKQTLWCHNEEMIARYSGEQALAASMESYKSNPKKPPLTPSPLPKDLAGKI